MKILHPPDWKRPSGYVNGVMVSGAVVFVAGQMLDGNDSFFRSEVRQKRRRHHVADCIDALLGGLLVFIDLDESLFNLDLCLLQTETVGERHAANRDQQHLGLEPHVLAL